MYLYHYIFIIDHNMYVNYGMKWYALGRGAPVAAAVRSRMHVPQCAAVSVK